MEVYLDNAATSFPKPKSVYKAIDNCLRTYCGNPGRSGHRMAVEAGRVIFETRSKLADLIGAGDLSRVIFTLNATDALNLGIKGLLKKGDHVITSTMEHNSVLRPLKKLEINKLISVTRVKSNSEGFVSSESIEANIKSNTKLIVINHASNVVGTINPADEIGKIARKHKIFFMLDASQTMGAFPINVNESHIDMLAAPGHKSLLGPQGTGFLYIKPGLNIDTLKEGGTGSHSNSDIQPKMLPERYEPGTLNTPGLAGLGAAIDFINKKGIHKIRESEMEMTEYLLLQLKEIPEITIFGPKDPFMQMPVISIEIKNIDSGELGTLLSEKYQIMTRVGIHCAPLAHRSIKTFPRGTLRMSLGAFTTQEDIDYTIDGLKKIIAHK